MTTEINGWRFPDNLDVPGEDAGDWYRIQYGKTTVYGLSWPAHVDFIHQLDDDTSIETDVVDSGIDNDGLRYAAVKATIVIDDRRYESLQAADQASNQVRDPEYTWAVAESRALKRAVKKALNIKPVDKGTTQAADEEAGSSTDSRSRSPPVPAEELEEPASSEPEPEPEPAPTADVSDSDPAW